MLSLIVQNEQRKNAGADEYLSAALFYYKISLADGSWLYLLWVGKRDRLYLEDCFVVKGKTAMHVDLLSVQKKVFLVTFAFLAAILLVFSPLFDYPAFATKRASAATDKAIVVSTGVQRLYAYENGEIVYSTLIMTGRDSLPTPLGTFHIFAKLSPTMFTSPWPKGSSNWYPPTYINYALEFKSGGFFLHDATWHSVFGRGSNRWHRDPRFGWQDGSHGCVAMPLSAAAWLYRWAPIGTVVNIY